MITEQDRKEACHLDISNHGSWCWDCWAAVWINDQDQLRPDCSNCLGTLRDLIPWCELLLGGRS